MIDNNSNQFYENIIKSKFKIIKERSNLFIKGNKK